MDTGRIDTGEMIELMAFVAVARHRSFRQAAIERGTTSSAVSHAIKRLEDRLGLRLLHRTTRSVSLTEPGSKLLSGLGPAFENVRHTLEQLDQFRDSAFGTVRLNVPTCLAGATILPILKPVLARNAGLHVDIVATDRLVDIAAEGFDAGIRMGDRMDQGMVAVRIGPTPRFAVVASPDYAQAHGLPKTPHDLARHTCIRYRFSSGALFFWEFERGSEAVTIDVRGSVTLDNQALMIDAALSGLGLAYVWDFQLVEHLRAGRLVRCLDDWCPPLDDLFIYYPSRKYVSAGLRTIIDALRARRTASRRRAA